MSPIGSNPIFVYFLLTVPRQIDVMKTNERKTCNSVFDTKNNVQWRAATSSTLSEPICVNKNMEVSQRKCENGQWLDEPECFQVQPKRLRNCPEKFQEVDKFCYVFSPKSRFPPRCPFNNVASFQVYKDIITREMPPVWVPVKRDGFGFMVWIEASSFYKTIFNNYTYSQFPNVDDCVLYYNGSYFGTSCEQEHVGVCAYKHDELRSSLCSRIGICVQSDFTNTSQCTCVKYFPFGTISPAGFPKPFQNQAARMLLGNNTCTFGLTKLSNGNFVWNNSLSNVTYTFWAQEVKFDDEYRFGAHTKNGWILTKDHLPCVLYETAVAAPEASLQLYNSNHGVFLLNVTNPHLFVKLYGGFPADCFTDAIPPGQHVLHTTLLNLTKLQEGNNFAMYLFQNVSSSLAHYYCQGWRINDSVVVTSNTVFFVSNANFFEFVAVFNISYIIITVDPLGEAFVGFLKKSLYDSLNRLNYVYQKYIVQFMKIEDFDVVNANAMINVHFSSLVSAPKSGELEEYRYLSQNLSTIQPTSSDVKDMKLVSLLSATTCFAETDGLNWPSTYLDSEATSEEICLWPNMSLVSRRCGGSFLDGAKWSTYDKCKVFGNSSVSQKLFSFLNESFISVNQIFALSQNYDQFMPLDVYLLGRIIDNLTSIDDGNDALLFAATINNILKINRTVLRQSQKMLGATNIILDSVNSFLDTSMGNFRSFSENFACWSSAITEMVGVAIYDDNTNPMRQWNASTTLDNMDYEHLKSAIWLSPDLVTQISPNDSLVFTVYFNNSFFQDDAVSCTSTIFGVSISNYVNLSAPVNVLQRIDDKDSKFDSCGFWTNNNGGRWKITNKPTRLGSFILCEFHQLANFAVLFNESSNITEDLIGVLHSNASTIERLEQLSSITNDYEEFQAIDVSYVGMILNQFVERGKDDEEFDWDAFATIVSNLQEIERSVLLESQLGNRSTDKILSYVDTLIDQKEFQQELVINAANFALIIVDLKYKNFTGVAIMNVGNMFVVEILEDDEAVGHVTSQDAFDSGVVFSRDLLKQMVNKTKLIVTVFISDALFNENNTLQNVSKIFGVILPVVDHFQGPVSIIHNRGQNNNDQCVYWKYNQDDVDFGSWTRNGSKTRESDLVRCDYWHTTHFAVLLLENDDSTDTGLLYYITTINCIISSICLFCILLTALFFKRWRTNAGNQILLNFVAVSLLQIVVFYTSGAIKKQPGDYIICIVIGALLHYCIVAEFVWMFIMAILQFRRFVIVFGGPPKYVLLKACISGWVCPLLPVICILSIDHENYLQSNVNLCYPSGLGLYLGVWLPISIILFVNSIIFIRILYSVVCKKDKSVDVGSNDLIHQWRLGVLLFFMFGLTWVFGLLSNLEDGTVFLYLFCITATLQGFILFVFFIIWNVNTRVLYLRVFKRFVYNVQSASK